VATVPKRVLIADDHAIVRVFLSKSLEASGFEPFEAANGCEAIEKAIQHNPDVIILDAVMPRMGGIQVARELRAKSLSARIVLLTYDGGEISSKELRSANVQAVISKTNLPEMKRRVIAFLVTS
jgi:CheY-like chemotaxis protein